MVPKSAPYKCPWQGCEMVKKDRFSISLHYGITHKVTLKLMHDMPEDALKEPIEVVCKLCQQSFTAHRYLYTHLSDTHFQPEIGKKLGLTFFLFLKKNFKITFLFFFLQIETYQQQVHGNVQNAHTLAMIYVLLEFTMVLDTKLLLIFWPLN